VLIISNLFYASYSVLFGSLRCKYQINFWILQENINFYFTNNQQVMMVLDTKTPVHIPTDNKQIHNLLLCLYLAFKAQIL